MKTSRQFPVIFEDGMNIHIHKQCLLDFSINYKVDYSVALFEMIAVQMTYKFGVIRNIENLSNSIGHVLEVSKNEIEQFILDPNCKEFSIAFYHKQLIPI